MILFVVGMGDFAIARYGSFPLASVDRHSAQIGAQAAKFLLERIQGHKGPPRKVLIAPHLIVRESAMPPRRAERKIHADG